MKLKPTSNQTLETNGIKSSVSFGIKESGFAHIFNVLRNQLYSDKILAVIREYTCNAVDAMVAAEKRDTPIQVTLPSLLNPYFKVRDFGDALSDNEIKDIYAFYGESTKRNTNDQIGMLGIGSKAAFAYGDNFVINSYLNGKKHTYNAFIDPSQIGQISKLEVVDSNEENGIEIVVPVQEDDFDEFVSKAKDLFKYFPVQPLIKGVTPFEYKERSLLFEGTGWKWFRHESDNRWGASGNAIAVMGNIAYPVESYDLALSDDDQTLNSLVSGNLVMTFDIGELEISASREKLQFTDGTRKTIVKRLKVLQKEIVATAKKEFKNCKTLFDAKCLYGTILDWESGLYDFRHILDKDLEWKGTRIQGSQFSWSYSDCDGSEGSKLVVYKKSSRHGSKRYSPHQTAVLDCSKGVVVIENDLPSGRGIANRVLPLIFNEDKTVYVFTFKNKKKKKELTTDKNFDAKILLASKLKKQPLRDFYAVSTSSGGSISGSPKHSVNAFTLDFEVIDEDRRYWGSKPNSDFYKCAKVDISNDSGYYVIIDKFLIEKDHDTSFSPIRMKEIVEAFNVLGVKFPSEIYAFKTKMKDKVEKNKKMINLWDWAKEVFKEKIENDNLVQSLNDRKAALDVCDHRQAPWVNIGVWKNQCAEIKNVDGDYSMLFRAITEMLGNDSKGKKLDSLQDSFAIVYGDTLQSVFGNVPPTHDLDSLVHKVNKKYSMLLFVDRWGYCNNVDKQRAVIDYVNVVDICSL